MVGMHSPAVGRRGPSVGFLRLVLGQGAFELGGVFWWLSLPLIAVEILGANEESVSALIAVCTWGGLLASGAIGWLADRRGHRFIYAGSVPLRVLGAAALVALMASGGLTFSLLLTLALVLSISEVAFSIGQVGIVADLCSEDELASRNGALRAAESGAQVGGSALGGLMLASWGAVVGPIVDGACALLSGLTLAGLRGIGKPSRSPSQNVRGVGVRTLLAVPALRSILVAQVFVTLASGISLAVEASFVLVTLESGAGVLGAVYALGSVGALVGALSAGRVMAQFGFVAPLRLGIAIGLPFSCLLPLATTGWGGLLVGVGNLGVSAGLGVFSVLQLTLRQTVVERALLGRVTGVYRTVSGVVAALGTGMGAAAVGFIGARSVLWVAAIVFSGAVVIVGRKAFARSIALATEPTSPASAGCV